MEQFILPLCVLALSFLAVRSLNKMLNLGRLILLAIAPCLLLCLNAAAQDVPRFEVGGGFTVLHTAQHNTSLAPSIDGVFNFGRFFSIDGTFNWFPHTASNSNFFQGQFGGKAGYRTQHFGFFGKVRPGFISIGNSLREIDFTQAQLLPPLTGIAFLPSFRVDRLTEKTLDLGGVLEYYPAKHWSLRYEMGDTLRFTEPTKFVGNPFIVGNPSGGTTNNFQVGAGFHYRF
jgi:hypothetical protein